MVSSVDTHNRFSLLTRSGYSAFVPTFDLTTFITSYIGVLVYVLNVVVWKLVHRTRRVRGQEIYFTSE